MADDTPVIHTEWLGNPGLCVHSDPHIQHAACAARGCRHHAAGVRGSSGDLCIALCRQVCLLGNHVVMCGARAVDTGHGCR